MKTEEEIKERLEELLEDRKEEKGHCWSRVDAECEILMWVLDELDD